MNKDKFLLTILKALWYTVVCEQILYQRTSLIAILSIYRSVIIESKSRLKFNVTKLVITSLQNLWTYNKNKTATLNLHVQDRNVFCIEKFFYTQCLLVVYFINWHWSQIIMYWYLHCTLSHYSILSELCLATEVHFYSTCFTKFLELVFRCIFCK